MKPRRVALVLSIGFVASQAVAAPITTHPRLWLRDTDVARLRSWAVPGNPIYGSGLAVLAAQAKADMDAGLVPAQDGGGNTYEQYPSENYAELFAFLSIVDNDPVARADYAQRAHTLLMYVMDRAVLGAAPGQPFRDPVFSISDRSRWHGEAFPLTVDWIYSSLTPADKAEIRTVFLRWIGEDENADTTTDNHPVPVGVVNDPALLSDPVRVRWSANNYYTAHMRNIGLMAMSFDAADDPGGQLTSAALLNATGAWLYVIDSFLRNDGRGGLGAEGFEYSPQSLGYVAQFLYALHTAGQDDPATWGPQVVLTGNPFWSDVVTAYLNSLSPAPVVLAPPWDYLGPVYLPAWYGAAQSYWAPDFIDTFGPLGLYDAATGNGARLDALRFIETNMPPGGAADLTNRVDDQEFHQHGILSFMLLDPAAPPPADPRPSQPTRFFAPGIGRLLARTSWSPTATWLTYALCWYTIDHQVSDGNEVELYRKGEWLTKQRCGYDLDYAATDNHNSLSLLNDQVSEPPTDYRYMLWQRGSQWEYVVTGDPQIVARSFGSGFVYVTGDATNLYNSAYEGVTDIVHASRSMMWIEPDHVIIYDRAQSQTAGRFKRFWLNLPAQATVTGALSTMTTASGQQLFVTTLLPAAVSISSSPAPVEPSGSPANAEPMQYRLLVESTPPGTNVSFLNVLQGADAGASADAATYFQTVAGTAFVGAVVANNVTLFKVSLSAPFVSLDYGAPTSATVHRITGLTPGAGYTVTWQVIGTSFDVRVTPSGPAVADAGGALVLTPPSCTSFSIGPPSLPTGIQGTAYSQALSGSGGNPPYSFSVSAGSLPPGLSLSFTGVLSGTPTATGVFNFTVLAVDAINCFASKSYDVVVTLPGCGAVVVVPGGLPDATVSLPYSLALTASGGTAPYNFTLTGGTLPPGIALAGTGSLSGTPTAPGIWTFTVTVRDAAGCIGGRTYTLRVGNLVDYLVGRGLGLSNANEVRIYTGAGVASPVDFYAYAAAKWGVNVAAGKMEPGLYAQILAGPGPGDVFGPQARGFRRDGSAMSKVNFYAYGTLKYGVNVGSGDVDRDAYDEILTGAGPGAVFGPHVRGWNVDDGAAVPIAKISFYAYATLKYGVNVAGAALDADGYSELLTGPGPGVIFGPQVRGFNYDGIALSAISKINFNAFATPQYGVNLAGGDVDLDALAEIACAPGPGPTLPSRFLGYNWDGGSIAPLSGFDATPFSTLYGGRPGLGDVATDGRADLLCGAGRDPAADATVRAYAYSGTALSLIPGSFLPFALAAYGVNVSVGGYGY